MVTGMSDNNLIISTRKLTKKRFKICSTRKAYQLRIPKGDQHLFEDAIKGIDGATV